MVWKAFLGFVIILCFTGTGQTATLMAPNEDVGDPVPAVAWLVGYQHYSTADVSDTYGGLLLYGLRLSWLATAQSWFFLTAQYGQDSGNPYYDTPDFEGSAAAHLSVLPLLMGFRWNTTTDYRFRFYFGLAFEAAWAEERVPAVPATFADSEQISRGWLYGFSLSLSPEWRAQGGRHAVGLDVGYDHCGGDIGKGLHRHDLNLSGFGGRLYYALQL